MKALMPASCASMRARQASVNCREVNSPRSIPAAACAIVKSVNELLIKNHNEPQMDTDGHRIYSSDDTFYFQFWLARIEDQSNTTTCGCKVVQALSNAIGFNRLDTFKLNDHEILH